ncbi:SLAM family member 8 isoform X1 [Epinephelus fuscoguttatus]|uniref:SLAM family member 8 isoform X1 n=1 Tax=Epinephelus fuscoguttatus TaxID=293821 RepID=UPI0020D14B48|nr:SLAM family member 8 isoform X1 [Epinephelus fuscoguttatus]
MAGVCLRYAICLLTYRALQLFWLFLHDVEASSCQRVIHKKVGDTVELSSCLPTEGVILALWKYGSSIIAEKYKKLSGDHQFKGRLDLNPTNFSLTVRELTLQDSGNFIFVSAVTDKQRGTVTITLKVHEPITKEPDVFFNSTWHPSNGSCTALLKCSAPTESNVTYNWTVGNQTITGSSLEYSMRPQDRETKFTCTISNIVSEMSASRTESCSNKTADPSKPVAGPSSQLPLIIGCVIGILLIIPLLLLLVFYTKSKDLCCNRLTQSQAVSQDETQQQVYSSLLHADGSVYETMRGSKDAETGDDCAYENTRGSAEAGKGTV